MRKTLFLPFFIFLLFVAPRASADIAAIHASALPQETAVLVALDDAEKLEPYSRAWSNKWQYSVAKDEVANRLGKDLGFLTLALKSHPDNLELLLLTGLVARYAYNVDVEGSHEIAVQALDQAQKLVPADIRAPWFRATLKCQTNELKAGAEEFLSLEAGRAWDQFPAAFWEDYTNCATLSNMPAHTLRAISYIGKLRAPNPAGFESALDIAHHRFVPFDPKKDYQPKEVWSATETDGDPLFTSTTCGLRLRARGNWTINQIAVQKGSCVAYFSTGPYKATAHSLHPSILVLVKQPEGNETLEQFARKFEKDGTYEPFAPSHCPVAACIAMKGVQPGMYKKDGDGHGRIVFFEREDPAFPGLIFEAPIGLPKPEGGEGMTYYRPSLTQQRIPGKLYYVVLLDVAASIEEPAMKDYDFFLENLLVE